jgi:hypothetical protein
MATERKAYPKYPEEDGVIVLSVEPWDEDHSRINYNDDSYIIVRKVRPS